MLPSYNNRLQFVLKRDTIDVSSGSIATTTTTSIFPGVIVVDVPTSTVSSIRILTPLVSIQDVTTIPTSVLPQQSNIPEVTPEAIDISQQTTSLTSASLGTNTATITDQAQVTGQTNDTEGQYQYQAPRNWDGKGPGAGPISTALTVEIIVLIVIIIVASIFFWYSKRVRRAKKTKCSRRDSEHDIAHLGYQATTLGGNLRETKTERDIPQAGREIDTRTTAGISEPIELPDEPILSPILTPIKRVNSGLSVRITTDVTSGAGPPEGLTGSWEIFPERPPPTRTYIPRESRTSAMFTHVYNWLPQVLSERVTLRPLSTRKSSIPSISAVEETPCPPYMPRAEEYTSPTFSEIEQDFKDITSSTYLDRPLTPPPALFSSKSRWSETTRSSIYTRKLSESYPAPL